ncbi:predicted protein [Nematostella vectensis]|uniref:BTB domain-containing protein n=1 Tax=Nematostella vectensis TaxID=45351 RepID=A7RWV2_NEMVE|nr:BTB/POZ domain-containing protein 2 [Nematostella vectensis]XP_048579142.1 BTB/POZ domain-containing protein 2-like [Nematostella vectensis]EDO44088.1 predicted protein [Nematostella vectensis]|eukprot:XP_001636151.1 predicted protein [Nematostella vectensis]
MSSNAWQPAFKTIKERGKHMWKNPVLSDVEFVVCTSAGEKISIPAHRYVLSVSSPVFEAMFHGAMAESSREISLPDCYAEALSEMLRYAYYDEVKLTGSNAMAVMYLAEKYNFPGLKEKCSHYLQENLEPKDVLFVLPEAMKIQDENLQSHCWELIGEKTEEVVTSDAFLSVTRELLCYILDRDKLRIKEIELFKAVDRWAEHQTSSQGLGTDGESKRRVLGEEAIRRIRFPVISQEQFAKLVLPKDILIKEEIIDIFAHYALPKVSDLFSSKARVTSLSSVTRFMSKEDCGWSYSGGEDSLCIKVSNQVRLVAVSLFGSEGNTYTVELAVEKEGQQVYQQEKRTFSSSELMNPTNGSYYNGFVVSFDHPVTILPNTKYCLRAWINGPNSYYGNNGQSVVKCEDVEFTFMGSATSSS